MAEYQMEELLPVVAKLAERYTGLEHSSLTYERAAQLMEAVLYCIQEGEQDCESGGTFLISGKKLSARQACEEGYQRVVRKVSVALNLYNEIAADFLYYENICLRDTFLVGLPEFFRRYDARFAPMDTLLTLDYPILMDLSRYCGVDRIYPYITCIQLEQKFLHKFQKDNVLQILCQYNRDCRNMIENLTEIVLSSALEHLLAGKPLSEPKLSEDDKEQIRRKLCHSENVDIRDKLREAVQKLVDVYYEGDPALRNYLRLATDNIAVRMSIYYR